MSSRHNSARHRAQTVRTNPLGSVSKAVSANAGTVGRQAAVIAAASGLILSMGLPAKAADTNAGVSASTESGSAGCQLAVTAAPTATVSFERPVVKTKAGPEGRNRSAAQSTDDGRPAAARRYGHRDACQANGRRFLRRSFRPGSHRLHRHRQPLRLGRHHSQRLGLLRLHPVGLRPGRHQHSPRQCLDRHEAHLNAGSRRPGHAERRRPRGHLRRQRHDDQRAEPPQGTLLHAVSSTGTSSLSYTLR